MWPHQCTSLVKWATCGSTLLIAVVPLTVKMPITWPSVREMGCIGSATPLDLPYVGAMLDDLRLGVAYQAGDGLDAWKLSTGFPF